MNIRLGNQTNPSFSGPGADAAVTRTPRLPSARWLPSSGRAAILVLRALEASTPSRAPIATALFVQVQGSHIKTATIDQSGAVTGTLDQRDAYTTSSRPPAGPRAPEHPQSHHVVITALGTQTGFGTVILSLLPCCCWWAPSCVGSPGPSTPRAASWHRASKAKSTTRSDLDPVLRCRRYEASKREVTEVVDFLKHPTNMPAPEPPAPRGADGRSPVPARRCSPGRGRRGRRALLRADRSSSWSCSSGRRLPVRELFANAASKRLHHLHRRVDAIGQRRGGRSSVTTNGSRPQSAPGRDGRIRLTAASCDGGDQPPRDTRSRASAAGRFDRQLRFPSPINRSGRPFWPTTPGQASGPDVDLLATPGHAGLLGADLANLINEAAIVAVRDGRDVIAAIDLDEARDGSCSVRAGSNALLPGKSVPSPFTSRATPWCTVLRACRPVPRSPYCGGQSLG